MNSFFVVFAHRLDAPGPPTTYRRDDGKVVVYDTRLEAEAAAAELTPTNKRPNTFFTVTEFELTQGEKCNEIKGDTVLF